MTSSFPLANNLNAQLKGEVLKLRKDIVELSSENERCLDNLNQKNDQNKLLELLKLENEAKIKELENDNLTLKQWKEKQLSDNQQQLSLIKKLEADTCRLSTTNGHLQNDLRMLREQNVEKDATEKELRER